MADNSPTAPVDICNLALTELKVSPISSLDQKGNEIADLCNRHYDIVRKTILRRHIWNFAKTEANLARSSFGTSNSFDDVYPAPKTFLRLISVGDVLVWTKQECFDIRSIDISGTFIRSIVLNNSGAATLAILYIRNVISVSEFDPLFITLFKFEIAMAISQGVTLKPSTKASIQDGLTDARLQARSIDGQERPPVRIQNSKFINARRFALRTKQAFTTVFSDE